MRVRIPGTHTTAQPEDVESEARCLTEDSIEKRRIELHQQLDVSFVSDLGRKKQAPIDTTCLSPLVSRCT